MYWLELLVQPLALIGWAMVLLSVLLFRKLGWQLPTIISVFVVTTYFIISTPFPANIVVGLLEQTDTAGTICGSPTGKSIIIVLAGGINDSVNNDLPYQRLHIATIKRTLAGIQLAKKAPGSRLLLAGGTGGQFRESDLMRSMAIDYGIDEKRIIVERESHNTFESAKKIASMFKNGLKAESVMLLTSAMHMPRAAATFQKQGVGFCTVKVDRRQLHPPLYTVFIPQISAMQKTMSSIHELLGYIWYWLTGKL